MKTKTRKGNWKEFLRPTKWNIILGIVFLIGFVVFFLYCSPTFFTVIVEPAESKQQDVDSMILQCGPFFGGLSVFLMRYWILTIALIYVLSSLILYFRGKKK